MPIAITSELRNQLKVLYRFDRGIALGSCLYPLKKPFHVLETLANNARCCVLSARVGARSVATTEIREEPIAYLLDNREANNDPAAAAAEADERTLLSLRRQLRYDRP